MKQKTVNGFSQWPKEKKMRWVCDTFASSPSDAKELLKQLQYPSSHLQDILDGFSENTISNFPLPFGIAPHFLINGTDYCVPMVIEESSVVAAASAGAKFWKTRGGVHARVLQTKKVGQIHFIYSGEDSDLQDLLPSYIDKVKDATASFTKNMRLRGGGILQIELEKTSDLSGVFQLRFHFETCDSMGANFINSILEESAQIWSSHIRSSFPEEQLDIIMSILSNHTPECLVRAEVSCPIEDLGVFGSKLEANTFAERFKRAIDIAHHDIYRATTHNKGIYNGIDAVVLATGNDFRAVEAAGHSYASRDGAYRSLSHCDIQDGIFRFWLEVPMALGTVGGLTQLHPLAHLALDLLGKPTAYQLMEVVSATGLVQNFSAIRSLVTVGIQKGHMKMHLYNILTHLKANEEEKSKVLAHFENNVVSFGAVREFIEMIRSS